MPSKRLKTLWNKLRAPWSVKPSGPSCGAETKILRQRRMFCYHSPMLRLIHIATLAVACLLLSCIHVQERVEHRDTALGAPRLLQEKQVGQRVLGDAELHGERVRLQLQDEVICSRHQVIEVERVSSRQRTLMAESYPVLFLEAFTGLAAVTASLWMLTADDPLLVNSSGTVAITQSGRILTGLSLLGVSGWLLGSFGYHSFYLLNDGETVAQTSKKSWTKATRCSLRPLGTTDVSARAGTVELAGTTGEDGYVFLAAPEGVDLPATLAETNWQLVVKARGTELQVTVYAATTKDTANKPDEARTLPRSRPTGGGSQPRSLPAGGGSQPAVDAGAALPSRDLGDTPPVPSAPPPGPPQLDTSE